MNTYGGFVFVQVFLSSKGFRVFVTISFQELDFVKLLDVTSREIVRLGGKMPSTAARHVEFDDVIHKDFGPRIFWL